MVYYRIKKLLHKRSIKNGFWMYLLQFFNAVIPLLTLPYITRVLGSSKYGVFSIALNLVAYMQVTVEYGFGMSATRKIALNSSRDNINNIFSGVLYSRIILFLLCIFFSIIYAIVKSNDPSLCTCLFVLNICLLGYCVQVNWLFQGLQEMKFISIVNIIARSISVILIFSFVRDASDLFLYCFFYSVSPLLSGVIGCVLAIKRYNIKLIRLGGDKILSELVDGWYVFTTQLSSKVFGAIGITFLALFASEQEVGIFSAIQKVPNVLILCWSPMSQVLYPLSSQKLQKDYLQGKQFVQNIKKYLLPVFIFIALLISLFAKSIVNTVFGSEYSANYYWLLPLLVWVIFSIENNFTGIQILLGSGHDQEYSKCFQVSVVCTIILNFFLIFFFRGNGCSIAPAISEFILFILLTEQRRKIDKGYVQ